MQILGLVTVDTLPGMMQSAVIALILVTSLESGVCGQSFAAGKMRNDNDGIGCLRRQIDIVPYCISFHNRS